MSFGSFNTKLESEETRSELFILGYPSPGKTLIYKLLTYSIPISVNWWRLQIHGNSVQGRILHGNSPSELIERFTETIGRPPELPGWIISGAVVGMQGGTNVVRKIWDELKAHEVPISAFWLQVIQVCHFQKLVIHFWIKLSILYCRSSQIQKVMHRYIVFITCFHNNIVFLKCIHILLDLFLI